eukprot:4178017-Amphidinium_carterae.1
MALDPVSHVALPRIVSLTECGESLNAEQKAWVHETGTVVWELRRFVIAFLPRRKALDLSHYLRDNRANLTDWFNCAGAVSPVNDSQQAVRDRGG